MGGGRHDDDVRNMSDAAASYPLPQQYEGGERQSLDESQALFNKPASLKHYKTGTKLFTAELTDKGEVFARMKMEVRAPAEQVLAYYMGHAEQFTNQDEDGTPSHTTIGERCNDHRVISQSMISTPSPLQDRQRTLRTLWEKLDDNTYFLAQKTCVHQQFPEVEGAVRMSVTRLIKLTKTSESATKIEFVGSMNLCGSFPAQVNNIVTISRIVRTPITLATFFTAIRAADAFDEEDAKQLGQLLFRELRPHRHNAHVLREKVGEMICLMNVLSAAQAKYRFIDELLFPIIRNEMKKGAAQTSFSVTTPLVALSANEAGRIGRPLVMLLMSNATCEAAVEEHNRMFPALGGLDREFNWFRPMMDAIAAELMNKVAYGVKVRADLGAGLSMADMISDTVVILDFRRTGNMHYASLLMGMIGLNLVFQLLIAFLQTVGLKQSRMKSFLFEALSIVTFTKPGIDAWKVASGAEQPPGAVMNPLVERCSLTRV